MTLFSIIPVKPLADGKTRLQESLSQKARLRLNEQLFDHVLRVSVSAIGADRTIVVSQDALVLKKAGEHGALAVHEKANLGLNGALTLAASHAVEHGADALLVLPVDLPLLSTDDIAALRDNMAENKIVIAPDEACSGTNALLVSPPEILAFAFGTGSFRMHMAAARRAGIDPVIIRRATLAFDVDTPDDYVRFRSSEHQTGLLARP
jgi:2-phospho-L-lactate guanylyltransferase